MQAHEQTAITTTLHPLKVWEQFIDNVIPFLNVQTWKTFFITSKMLINSLSLLWRKKVMDD